MYPETEAFPRESLPSVLVVDDDSDILETARLLLEPRGYVVDTAVDGWQGLLAAHARHYDVIVLDVNMPGLDGPELGRALREDPATASSPLIFQTSLDERELQARFDGYDAYVPKPAGAVGLVEAVSKVLHRDLAPT